MDASVDPDRTPTPGRAAARRGPAVATVPLMVLAGAAAAYGFLEGATMRDSLKLNGALALSGLGVITVLFARSAVPSKRAFDASYGPHSEGTERDRRDVLREWLAFLSVAVGLIHFAVIEQHFTEFWLYGAFFVAVGLFEMLWALLILAVPSRPVYWAGVIINALTVAAYLVTRTVGVLVGPSAHKTEMIGFGDLTATAFEGLLVLGSLLLLVRSWGRAGVRAPTSEALTGAVAVAVAAFTVLAMFSTVGGSPFVPPAG